MPTVLRGSSLHAGWTVPFELLSSSKLTAHLRKRLHTWKLNGICPSVKPTVTSSLDEGRLGSVVAKLLTGL